MQSFVNDDTSYLAWVGKHSDGFVLNVPQQGTTAPVVLHTARCSHVTNPLRTNYTTTTYFKMCSLNQDELIAWGHAHGQVKACGYCHPGMGRPLISPAVGSVTNPHATNSRLVEPIANAVAVANNYWVSCRVETREHWQLWRRGPVLRTVNDLKPRLASWDKKTSPSQIALQTYLDDVIAGLGPLPQVSTGLYLHLDVDVEDPKRLKQGYGYDLENYLTPLFGGKRLDPALFRLVSATKQVSGGSRLVVGAVIPRDDGADEPGWGHFSCRSRISVAGALWKQDLRAALTHEQPTQLPDGPVEVQIAWHCTLDSGRRWVDWWKPTGDAMGPVLGEPDLKNPFNPADDRIVALQLHLVIDEATDKGVNVGMWWRPHPNVK